MEENKFNISSNQLQIVKHILNENFKDVTIWIFGSRVSGNNKEYSDLDIALQFNDYNDKIYRKLAASLSDFIDSDLPFKVDIIDYNSLSGIFKQNVDETKIKLILN